MDAALAAFIDTLNGVAAVAEPAPEPVLIDGRRGRWEAAETHRLNAEQWERVTDETINEALHTDWPELRKRCTCEIQTNPLIAGVVETHATDIVGPDGPTMQVMPRRQNLSDTEQAKFDEYAREAEDVLAEWFAMPDFNEELSGPDMLRLWIRQLWGSGDFIAQKLTSRDRRAPVTLRLHTILPDRVRTPFTLRSTRDVVLGIERDKFGRRIRYYVTEPDEFGRFWNSNEYTPVPADMMVHGFRMDEPGQVRGVPWLAPALPTIGDLRQYGKHVMEAAKMAAALSVVLSTQHPDAPYQPITGSGKMHIPVGHVWRAPQQWTPTQIDPKQPAANFVEYTRERMREIGRVVQMPLMMILLGSEEHNFSSARFDAQIYQRAIAVFQNMFERQLTPCHLEVLQEAELAGQIRRRPQILKIGYQWTRLPHVDPSKEAKARELDLQTLSTTHVDVWSDDGQRPDQVMEKLRRGKEIIDGALGEGSFELILGKQPVQPEAEDPERTETESGTEKGGQAPIVRSTQRAVPAIGY